MKKKSTSQRHLRKKSKLPKSKAPKKSKSITKRNSKNDNKKDKTSDRNDKNFQTYADKDVHKSQPNSQPEMDPVFYNQNYKKNSDNDNLGTSVYKQKTPSCLEKSEKSQKEDKLNERQNFVSSSNTSAKQNEPIQRTLSSNKSQMPVVPDDAKAEPDAPFRLAEHISEVFKQPSYIQDMMIPIPLPPAPPADPDDEYGQTTFNFKESKKREKYSVMNLLKYTIRRSGDHVPQNETQLFNYNSNLRKYSSFNPDQRTAIPDLIPTVELEDSSGKDISKQVFICQMPNTFKNKESPANCSPKEIENELLRLNELKEQQLIEKFKSESTNR